MNKCQSYGNSYLRHLKSSLGEGNSMTMYTLSEQELLLVLETIPMYVQLMNRGEEITIEITTNGESGTIKFSRKDSKEMSS